MEIDGVVDVKFPVAARYHCRHGKILRLCDHAVTVGNTGQLSSGNTAFGTE